MKISVVINTLNEEKNITRALNSVKWADEIIVCDMHSDDNTAQIAKKLGAQVIFYKKEGYVEPARNFAISKAMGSWILVLDADEEIPESLAKRLKDLANRIKQIDYVEIPRKNFIFGRWMKASRWWPDYHIRFFRAGKVKWGNGIHSKPETEGEGITLTADENLAITHRNYNSLSQYIMRMDRYTTIQAKELVSGGYKFRWQDLIQKPLSEFLSRFFAGRGFEDGLHGLALSLLQAFSFLIVYLKVWEKNKFKTHELKLEDLEILKQQGGEELSYWFKKSKSSANIFKTFLQKFKR